MTDFQFHPFELSYLMGLMRADSVAGLPDEVLFPSDQGLREKVFQQGLQRLKKRNLIQPVPEEPGRAVYAEPVLRMAATLADPRVVILVERQGEAGRQAATVFLSNADVVELTQVRKDGFRLVQLADAVTALHRIRRMLSIPVFAPEGAGNIPVDRGDFERWRGGDADYAPSQFPGWPEACVRGFLDAVAAGPPHGTVTLLRRLNQRFASVRMAAVYRRGLQAWLTVPDAEFASRLNVQPVDLPGFVQAQMRLLASLAG